MTTQTETAPKSFTQFVQLDADAIPNLRWALAQGLHAIAEVERVQAAQLHAKRCGEKVPDGCGPITAMASNEDLTRYASALLWLDMAEPIEE